MVKKLIAKRKLRRKCDHCKRVINKGEVFYKERKVHQDWDTGQIYGFDFYYCPKCLWKIRNHDKRRAEFIKNCKHPERFRDMQYSYMPGEAIMEPSHEECMLCGQRV
ncbi:MAG: hypothetical protein M0R49_09145 [Limnochordia bacterium]|jgi:hypothetical protein|nr:hypothetical protein [Limnochordia bacterium]